MVGYIYKIQNLTTQKSYIGQTINIERRKRDHFNDLQNHTHVNPKLQAAWDKYGKDDFTFEFWKFSNCTADQLNQLECDFIEKYDSLNNGYNLAPGGGAPPNPQIIKDEDIITFLCVQNKFGDGYGKTCEQIFGWADRTASNIKRHTRYLGAIDRFNKMSIQERDQKLNDFLKTVPLFEIHTQRQLKQGGCEKAYLLNQDDYNFAFAAQELGYKASEVAYYFQIKPTTVKDWFNQRSRLKERINYESLPMEDRLQIQQQVREAHLEACGNDKFTTKTEVEIMQFLCYDKFFTSADADIQRTLKWPEGTCYAIRKPSNYHYTKAKMALKAEEEQLQLAKEFQKRLDGPV